MTSLQLGKGKTHPYNKDKSVLYFLKKSFIKFNANSAVLFGKEQISYKRLNERANQLAHFFIESGIKKGDYIGIFVSPSIDFLITLLAIFKCGACYVPIDKSYPEKRILHILNDANPRFIISENVENCPLFKNFHLQNINNILNEALSYSRQDPCLDIRGEDPAYVIYTSGSTGDPKGILIPHRAVNNHMLWMISEFNFTENDKVLLKTPLTFDPSIWEILVPLYTGSMLVIPSQPCQADASALINLVNKFQITTLQLVPVVFQILLKKLEATKLKSLKRLFVGGESLVKHTKELFFKKLNCQLINLYGPAETTIDITFHTVKPNLKNFSTNIIGKPIYNTEIYVLNNQMNLAKMNEPGEIYIAGESIALGYLNLESLTKTKFIENPFSNHYPIMYKTGDIAKWLTSGELEFIGRKDNQIKLNGVRTEIEGMCKQLNRLNQVLNSFFIKKETAEGFEYLECYLLPQGEKEINFQEVRRTLAKKFPHFMIPKKFFLINNLPYTPNGKVDFHNLNQNSTLIKLAKPRKQIKSLLEDSILKIWTQILGMDNICITDNFYELGGDSLLGLSLIDSIEKLTGVKLSFEDILISNNIAQQAAFIEAIKCNDMKLKINSDNFIIKLNNSRSNKIIFLIHPVGGTVFWFTHLAKLLEPYFQVFGVQDPQINNQELAFNSIESMATFYYPAIKEISQGKNFIVGGASFGVTVAIEVAKLMQKDNLPVQSVISLDGWGIYPKDLVDNDFFRNLMQQQQLDWLTKFEVNQIHFDINRLFDIQFNRLQMLYFYEMKPLNFGLLLFKADETLKIFETIESSNNHWENYAKNLLVIRVPGNHETMFQKPFVDTLSSEMIKHLMPGVVIHSKLEIIKETSSN